MDDHIESAEDDKADQADSGDGQGDRFVPSDHRVADTPRRVEEDRRQADLGIEGEERRDPPPRREPFDRRTMGLEVVCRTTGSITQY